MSLKYNIENSLGIDGESSNIDTNLTINKNQSNQIKMIKSIKTCNLKNTNNQIIDLKNKTPLLLKEDIKLIKNNKLLNYLKTINSNKEHIYNNIHLSPKSRNSHSLISNNEYFSKSTSPKKIKPLYCDSSLGRKIIFYDNLNYIKLNSLFSLPPITKKKNPYNSKKSINTSNLSKYFITEINSNKNRFNSFSNKQKRSLIKLKNKKLGNINMQIKGREGFEEKRIHKNDYINNFMKFKYYDDINEKYEKKLRDDSFLDRGDKDKIIKIGKVSIFWKNVIEYCGSFIFAEKFKNIEKQFRKKNLGKEEEYYINKFNKGQNKTLYTNLLVNKIIHYQNNNNI